MEYFGAGALRSLDAYRSAVLLMCGHADRAFRLGDSAWLKRLQDEIYESSGKLPEHYSAVYQYGFCDVTLLYALCLVSKGDFNRVFNLCHTVDMMRHLAEQERIAQGRGQHPLSVTLTTLLNCLGDAKWQCSERERDRVMTPEEMENRWLGLMRRVPDYAAQKFGKQTERYKDCMDRLAWAGLQIAKTLTRYCPERVPGFIAYYNGQFGPALEAGAGAYCYQMLAPHDPKAWDYELAKLIIAGKLTADDEQYIRQRRRETYLEYVPATDTVSNFDSDTEFNRWRGLRLVSA